MSLFCQTKILFTRFLTYFLQNRVRAIGQYVTLLEGVSPNVVSGYGMVSAHPDDGLCDPGPISRQLTNPVGNIVVVIYSS